MTIRNQLEALGFKVSKPETKSRYKKKTKKEEHQLQRSAEQVGERTLIVLDLEATCESRDVEEPKVKREEMEIIEIGAAALVNGEVVDKFQIFVKPVINPVLTDFCKELTTITQEEVDGAMGLEEAMKVFDDWVSSVKDKHNINLWGSWGGYDLRQIKRNRKLLGIEKAFEIERVPHVNISESYRMLRGYGKKSGVGRAIRASNLKFEGTQHRALDDVLNIIRVINANKMLFKQN